MQRIDDRWMVIAVLVAALIVGVFSLTTSAFAPTPEDAILDAEPVRDTAVRDTGVPGSVINIHDSNITVEEAIFQIRYVLIFFVFGIIPFTFACIILYLFFRWIYRLIVGVI